MKKTKYAALIAALLGLVSVSSGTVMAQDVSVIGNPCTLTVYSSSDEADAGTERELSAFTIFAQAGEEKMLIRTDDGFEYTDKDALQSLFPELELDRFPQMDQVHAIIPGSRGSEVAVLQQALEICGVLQGGVDGGYGDLTIASVSSFQEMHNLNVTGSADIYTMLLLMGAYNGLADTVEVSVAPAEPYEAVIVATGDVSSAEPEGTAVAETETATAAETEDAAAAETGGNVFADPKVSVSADTAQALLMEEDDSISIKPGVSSVVAPADIIATNPGTDTTGTSAEPAEAPVEDMNAQPAEATTVSAEGTVAETADVAEPSAPAETPAAAEPAAQTEAPAAADAAVQAEAPAAAEPAAQTEAPAAADTAVQAEAPVAAEPAVQAEAPVAAEPAVQAEAPAAAEPAAEAEGTVDSEAEALDPSETEKATREEMFAAIAAKTDYDLTPFMNEAWTVDYDFFAEEGSINSSAELGHFDITDTDIDEIHGIVSLKVLISKDEGSDSLVLSPVVMVETSGAYRPYLGDILIQGENGLISIENTFDSGSVDGTTVTETACYPLTSKARELLTGDGDIHVRVEGTFMAYDAGVQNASEDIRNFVSACASIMGN